MQKYYYTKPSGERVLSIRAENWRDARSRLKIRYKLNSLKGFEVWGPSPR